MPHTLIAPSAMLALPPGNVTPRLTTAEAIAQVLARDVEQRAGQQPALTATRIIESGDRPARRYAIVFEYADRPPQRFEPHGVGA